MWGCGSRVCAILVVMMCWVCCWLGKMKEVIGILKSGVYLFKALRIGRIFILK